MDFHEKRSDFEQHEGYLVMKEKRLELQRVELQLVKVELKLTSGSAAAMAIGPLIGPGPGVIQGGARG